jgi:putative FmdB family regulatory protein
MPIYAFRCKDCQTEFTQSYASINAYQAATPTCPQCQSEALSRLIKRVNVQNVTHDYTRMDAQEMLTVLESGNQKQVDEMYRQVGAPSPDATSRTHERVQHEQARPTTDTTD